MITILVGSLVAMYVQSIEALLGIFYLMIMLGMKSYLKYIFFSLLVCSLVTFNKQRKIKNMNKTD